MPIYLAVKGPFFAHHEMTMGIWHCSCVDIFSGVQFTCSDREQDWELHSTGGNQSDVLNCHTYL